MSDRSSRSKHRPSERQNYVRIPVDDRRTNTPYVILASAAAVFFFAALAMVHDHAWTDHFLARLPLPGPAVSFASDPMLSGQLRIDNTTAYYTHLADQSPILVAEADLINDALMSVTNVVIEAHAQRGGEPVATGTATCGKPVSERLLRRLPHDELRALGQLVFAEPNEIRPSEWIRCQVTFEGMKNRPEEVLIRIASVEPLPGHRSLPPLRL